jgi:hypothetical protein
MSNKDKKDRAEKYEEKVKINGTLDGVLGASVKKTEDQDKEEDR